MGKRDVRSLSQKAAGLMTAYKSQGGDPRDLLWRLRTGRIPVKKEWKIMKHLKARTLGEAQSSMARGYEWVEPLSKEPLPTLKKKGWLFEKDIKLAKTLKKKGK
jgi:hypothetical protein